MKKILLLTLFLVLVILPHSLNAQTSSTKQIVPGAWLGKISAEGMDLRGIFNLKLAGDSLTATLDSPDQNAMDIPLGKVTLDNQKIVIQAPGINGEYNGVVTSDSTIDGTWTQNGTTFPMNLKKQVKKTK